jgi:hypothetical protein
VTTRPEDFEFEALCQTLESAVEQVPEAARDAISAAANALHYLYVTDQLVAFREYLRDADSPRRDRSVPSAPGWHAPHREPSDTQVPGACLHTFRTQTHLARSSCAATRPNPALGSAPEIGPARVRLPPPPSRTTR